MEAWYELYFTLNLFRRRGNMPNTYSAIRADRQTKKRFEANNEARSKIRKALKTASKDLSGAFSAVDRASKKNVIHWRRAARIKSRLAKALAVQTPKIKAKPSKKTSRSKK